MLPVLAIPVFCVATWVSALNDPSSGKINSPNIPGRRTTSPCTALHTIRTALRTLCNYAIITLPLRMISILAASDCCCVIRYHASLGTIAADHRSRSKGDRERQGKKGVAYCIVFTTFLHEVRVFNRAHFFPSPFLPRVLPPREFYGRLLRLRSVYYVDDKSQ